MPLDHTRMESPRRTARLSIVYKTIALLLSYRDMEVPVGIEPTSIVSKTSTLSVELWNLMVAGTGVAPA